MGCTRRQARMRVATRRRLIGSWAFHHVQPPAALSREYRIGQLILFE